LTTIDHIAIGPPGIFDAGLYLLEIAVILRRKRMTPRELRELIDNSPLPRRDTQAPAKMKTLAFFNNKGGVGKTTLLYHLAWMFGDMGKRVLVADFDPQANLTSMFLSELELEKLWDPDDSHAQSVMAPLSPMIRGLGDIGPTPLHKISPDIRLIPGDLDLSNFESNLSEAWGQCLDRREPAFRVTSSL